MSAPVEVIKLGGSVLTGARALPRVAAGLVRLAAGRRLLVVVSALRGSTDRLQALADRLCPEGPTETCAALLATGEVRAAAALAVALRGRRQEVTLLDPATVGPRTSGPPLDAEPVSVAVPALREALRRTPMVVLPGFVGRDAEGATTVLGRGGSDLTALFLAHALGARCLLIKDVGGVFNADPGVGPARRYTSLAWDDAARVSGGCVQAKALRFAASRGLSFFVGSLAEPTATWIGPGPTRLQEATRDVDPVGA